MNGRQSTIVLGLLAALYTAALVLLAPKMDSFPGEFVADAPLMLTAGLLFASPPVLAIWSVHGEAPTVNRLLLPTWLICVFFLAAGYGQVRNYGNGRADILLLMAIAWLTAYVVLLVALRLLRAVRGWRLRMVESAAPVSSEKPSQFTIRGLLVWTTAVAALCAGFRWLSAYGGFDMDQEPFAQMLYAVLIEGPIIGLLVALAGLPVVGVAWIVLPDGRRPYLRWTLGVVTAVGIAIGTSVIGCWINLDDDDLLAVKRLLMIESGVLAAGLAAACVLRACGYRLMRPSRATSSVPDAATPATGGIGSRRFAGTLSALGVAAILLAAYAPFRFETWRRADEICLWDSLGWNAELNEEGQVSVLRCIPGQSPRSEHLLAVAPNLGALDLSHTQLTDAQLWPYLMHCLAMPELELLNLADTKITDDGLSRLQTLGALKDLNLSYTGISLRRLPSLPRLERLALDGTAVGDAELAKLAVFTKLQTLRLLGTHVTDAGLAQLSALPALSWLDLSVTDVTDDAVASLAPLKQLRHVNLELTAVSEAGLVALSKAIPEADINVGADDSLLDRVFTQPPVVIRQGGSLGYATTSISRAPQTLKRLHARGNYPAGFRVGSMVFVSGKTVTDGGL